MVASRGEEERDDEAVGEREDSDDSGRRGCLSY
jgi:hypothetical protein